MRPVTWPQRSEVVQDDVQPEPRRHAVDRRVAHATRGESHRHRARSVLSSDRTLDSAYGGQRSQGSVLREQRVAVPRRRTSSTRTRRRTARRPPPSRHGRASGRSEVDVVGDCSAEIADGSFESAARWTTASKPSRCSARTSRTSGRASRTPRLVRPEVAPLVDSPCRARRLVARGSEVGARVPSRCSRRCPVTRTLITIPPPSRRRATAFVPRRRPRRTRSATRHSIPRSRIRPRNTRRRTSPSRAGCRSVGEQLELLVRRRPPPEGRTGSVGRGPRPISGSRTRGSGDLGTCSRSARTRAGDPDGGRRACG